MLRKSEIALCSDANLLLLDSVSSTNDYLLAAIKNNPQLPAKTVVLAEQQTSGRGQNQKVWQSPYAKNIYLSYYWQFVKQNLAGLSLCIALAVNSAMQKAEIHDIQLKWPNDIYYQNKKLGGILVESILATDQSTKVVVGVGINVNYSAELAAILGSNKYICLENILGKIVNRNSFVAILTQELFTYMDWFSQHGFGYFKTAWDARNLLKNRLITVQLANSADLVHGYMLGVDDVGAMLLDTADKGLLVVVSGSVVAGFA